MLEGTYEMLTVKALQIQEAHKILLLACYVYKQSVASGNAFSLGSNTNIPLYKFVKAF